MRLILVSPFRLPIDLPIDSILSHHETWMKVVADASRELESSVLPQAAIGNYGWGRLEQLLKQNEVIYGKRGVNDPGLFFKEFYTLRFGSNLERDDFSSDMWDNKLADCIFSHKAYWQCRLIDNTVGILFFNIKLPMEILWEYVGAHYSEFIQFTNNIPKKFLEHAHRKSQIQDGLDFAQQTLVARHRALTGENVAGRGQNILAQNSPVYPLKDDGYHHIWTHRAYVFSREEKNSMTKRQKEILRLVLPVETADQWIAGGGNAYGWGATVAEMDYRLRYQWLDALCISEYYYTCFDVADTIFPIAIAEQACATEKGQHMFVQQSARRARTTMRSLINEYGDLRIKAASQAHRALKAYYEIWRMEKLIKGMENKLGLLEELIQNSSDAIQQKYQNVIQYILFFITLLSVVGLAASLHDYLATGYDPRLPEGLSSFALSAGKGAVLMISGCFVAILLLVFVLFNKRK